MNQNHSLYAPLILLIPMLFVLLACNPQEASGAISGTRMAAANQLYEDGKFVEAAELYQALIDTGAQEGHLFYNLGGAYYKMGDLGRAVLNYRRAQRLLPRDGDVVANLSLARAQTLDRIETEHDGPIIDLVRRFMGWTTLNEAAVAALGLWIVQCGLGAGAIIWKQKRRLLLYLSGAVTTLLLLGLVSIGIRLLDERQQPPAVVVATEVIVHSGPGEDYLSDYTLHAGAEVRVVERRGDWVRITLPGDLQGWAPDQTVVPIIR